MKALQTFAWMGVAVCGFIGAVLLANALPVWGIAVVGLVILVLM